MRSGQYLSESRDARVGSPPLVSFLIPTYNRGNVIAETIDSVLAQSYPAIEIVVVDDGSTDETAAVMRHYADRVRYLRKPNGGLASARNLAQQSANGKYLAWVDSDDICEPQRAALQVACLEAFHDMVLCSSDFSAFDERGEVSRSYIGTYYSAIGRAAAGVDALYHDCQDVNISNQAGLSEYEERVVRVLNGNLYERLVWGNFIHPPTLMVRRTLAERVGAFDESLSVTSDYEWLIRASRVGRIGFLKQPLLRYRLSTTQMSGGHTNARQKLETVRVMKAIHAENRGFYESQRTAFDARIGASYLGAADALAETAKGKALSCLFNSVRYAGIGRDTLKVLAKVSLPGALMRFIRRSRGKGNAG